VQRGLHRRVEQHPQDVFIGLFRRQPELGQVRKRCGEDLVAPLVEQSGLTTEEPLQQLNRLPLVLHKLAEKRRISTTSDTLRPFSERTAFTVPPTNTHSGFSSRKDRNSEALSP